MSRIASRLLKLLFPVVWLQPMFFHLSLCEAFSQQLFGRPSRRPNFASPPKPAPQYRSILLQCADSDSDQMIPTTLEELQVQLSYIEALEERNKAQLDSFVNEQDQWESLEPFEQELLLSKEEVLKQIEKLDTR